MGKPNVAMGAMMTCSWGAAPSTLAVLQNQTVLIESMPAATILENIPMAGIPPFGMCSSLSNPAVASAPAGALGVLTPMPCTPVTAGPWTPGSTTTFIGGKPALTVPATCTCAFGGVISITRPGTVKTMTG
jgi:hypothetical protein